MTGTRMHTLAGLLVGIIPALLFLGAGTITAAVAGVFDHEDSTVRTWTAIVLGGLLADITAWGGALLAVAFVSAY